MVSPIAFNPFALLMDPAGVLGAVESSAGLSGLRARVFRPLDRGGRMSDADADLVAYDAEIDGDGCEDLEPRLQDRTWSQD